MNKLILVKRAIILLIFAISLFAVLVISIARHDVNRFKNDIIDWDFNKIISIGSNIYNDQYFQKAFESILESIDSDTKIVVLVYLGDICSSCASGRIIARLNEIQMNLKQVSAICIMLNSDLYKEDDLENIKLNEGLDIYFSVEDERLKEYEYKSFVEKANSTVQGLALIVNRSGEVLFATDLLGVNKRLNAAEYTSFIKQIVSISQHWG